MGFNRFQLTCIVKVSIMAVCIALSVFFFLEESLGEFNGAVIAMDVLDGGILAMASNPSFDPNLFVEGISTKDYSALQQNENRPLYDRALKGVYPPGSTVKPFVGLAGLETGSIHYHDNIYCPGHFKLPNHSHKYRDWKKTGHGAMVATGALTICPSA